MKLLKVNKKNYKIGIRPAIILVNELHTYIQKMREWTSKAAKESCLYMVVLFQAFQTSSEVGILGS